MAFESHEACLASVPQDEEPIGELAPCRNAKGSLSFPLREPLPLELIPGLTRIHSGKRSERDAAAEARL